MHAASPVIAGSAIVIDGLKAGIRIFARSHSDAEIEHLRSFGADMIVSGEQEIAQAMIDATNLSQPA
jgi:voltage-gated potassium channel Kch